MSIIELLQNQVATSIAELYQVHLEADEVVVNHTKKEFEGDFTIVTFPLAKKLKNNPAVIAEELGEKLTENSASINAFNVTGGFLNLSLELGFWHKIFNELVQNEYPLPKVDRKIMIEYSSPNTNKPLHLGHIRNILLGWSCAKMYEFIGYDVIKTQVVNDRGIAICKSMLAWQKYGQGETPTSSNLKGDHFIGNYYVLFNQKLAEEYQLWQQTETAQKLYTANQEEHADESSFFKSYANLYFNNYSALGQEVRDLLILWEKGDTETIDLWKKMNGWVYEGFNQTYQQLGVEFDVSYYESETYLLGKESIDKGQANNVFFEKEDGSIWVDLSDVGMDEKLVLRSDGTSVYMTQDIGTAQKRYKEFGFEKMVYVVGDEQDYHFTVLFEILNRLKEPYANDLYHLSYGMVDLPTGKMKSREGTVVDADILIQEILDISTQSAEERGELADLPEDRQKEIIKRIALGALKFFIIKVNPKKRMIFNPEESLDMQGQTGPYVQNAFVRIQSILRKADPIKTTYGNYQMSEEERKLTAILEQFVETVQQSALAYDPSAIANYAYNLARSFHRYYHEVRILNAESESARDFRLIMISQVAKILEQSFDLLGIEMPERM